jgi:hypothetical protein
MFLSQAPLNKQVLVSTEVTSLVVMCTIVLLVFRQV